jgi:hypothetical protein
LPELKTVLPNADFVIEGYVDPTEPLRGQDPARALTAERGWGWPLAKLAVKRHGGRIELESIKGQGSTFRVLLPLARDALARARPGAEHDPHFHQRQRRLHRHVHARGARDSRD